MTRPLLRPFVALALVLPIALAACDTSGGPAASVGEREISHERLAGEVDAFRFLTALSGAPCGAPVEGESDESACTRFTLTQVIQEELADEYASEHGVSVAGEDVTAAITQLEENLGGAAELDARLEENGLTRQDLQALAQRLLLIAEVSGAVVEERLDEESLTELYEESLAQFTTVEVAHILVESRREAEEIAAEATPENFARLARTSSTDTGSASSGGNLGSYPESQFEAQFDPTFVEAALSLEPGQISGPVQTQFGFHVIYLIARDVAAFEDVREQLESQQGGQIFQAWLVERYESGDVEVNPRYGRLDTATGEVLPIRSTAEEGSPTPSGTGTPTGP